VTDNLRDRIAAVLRDKLLDEIDGAVNGVDNIYVGDWVGESAIHLTPLADAVIAALGLRRASKPNDYDYVQYPPGDRYITDWIATTREPRSAEKLGLTGDGE
jgi:hypothetical protein